MRVLLGKQGSEFVVREAHFGVGGLAPRTVAAPVTSDRLVGKTWDDSTLELALQSLAEGSESVDNHYFISNRKLVEFNKS